MYSYATHPQRTRWNQAKHFGWDRLPARVRRWLLSTQSTSLLIENANGAPPTINIVRHGWQQPYPNESLILGLRRNTYAWIREIEIITGNKYWMLARTIFPRSTLRYAGYPNIIGDQPIGQSLFRDKSTERSDFEVAQLYGAHAPLSNALKWNKSVWGRRSIFLIKGWPLLLSEVFLPTFQEHLESDS